MGVYRSLCILLCVLFLLPVALAQVGHPMHNYDSGGTSQAPFSANWDTFPPTHFSLTGITTSFVFNGTIIFNTYGDNTNFTIGGSGSANVVNDSRCANCLLIEGVAGGATENITLLTPSLNLAGSSNNLVNVTFADIDLESTEGFSLYVYGSSSAQLLYKYNGTNNGRTNTTWLAQHLTTVNVLVPSAYAQASVRFSLNASMNTHLLNSSVDGLFIKGVSVSKNNGFVSSGSLGLQSGAYEYQPLVGNAFGDEAPEIFLPLQLTYGVFQYQSGSMSLVYDDLNATALDAIPFMTGVLYDGDGDSYDDLYYCGQRSNETVIVGYSFNPTPRELFSIVVGDNAPHPLCYMGESGGGSFVNVSYTPLEYDGDLFFFISNESARSGKSFSIYKVNPLNGSAQSLGIASGVGNPGYNQGCMAPGTFPSSFTSSTWHTQNSGTQPYYRPQVSPAICPDAINRPRISIPIDCYHSSPNNNARGILQVYADTLQVVNSFGNNGVYIISEFATGSTAPVLSSPACYEKSSGTQAIFLGYNGLSSTVSVYTAGDTSISAIDDNFAADIDTMSDLFLMEASDQNTNNDDDVCFIGAKTSSALHLIYCTDVDNPFPADEVEAYHYGSEPLFPTVMSSSFGYGLRGSAPQYLISNLGVFYPSDTNDPTNDPRNFNEEVPFLEEESFFFDPASYLPLIGTCIGADLDADTLAEVMCVTPFNITILGQSGLAPTLAGGTWSVIEVDPEADRCGSGLFCVVANGTTVTYQVQFSDFPQENVWFSYDCDTAFAPGATQAAYIENGYQFSCTYPDLRATLTSSFYLTNHTIAADLFSPANTKNATLTVAFNGLVCNYNGIPEPENGETQANCLADFVQAPSAAQAAQAANDTAAQVAREQFLNETGIDRTGQLGLLSIDENGQLVESGFGAEISGVIWRIIAYLLMLLAPILTIVIVVALIRRFTR